MDIEKLNRIGTVAESMGFKSRVYGSERAEFDVNVCGGSICIVYDISRRFFTEDIVYISSSAVNSADLDVFREFTAYLQKAIVIADKLKETKVNGA